LHSTFETEYCYFGRRDFDLNWDFANEEPRESDEDCYDEGEPECLGEEDSLRGENVTVFFWAPEVPEDGEDPCGYYTAPAYESVESFEDTIKKQNIVNKMFRRNWLKFKTYL
jgi:hypothetical protein